MHLKWEIKINFLDNKVDNKVNESNARGPGAASVLTPATGVGVLGSIFSTLKAGLNGVLDTVDIIASRVAQDTPIGTYCMSVTYYYLILIIIVLLVISIHYYYYSWLLFIFNIFHCMKIIFSNFIHFKLFIFF